LTDSKGIVVSSRGERFLIERGISFESLEYDFREKGSEYASEALGVPLDTMLKSLVVRLSDNRFIFVLIPSSKDISLKGLARAIGVKEAQMASERDTQRITGYLVGGISPFGAKTRLPAYLDEGVLEHGEVCINGGRRGLILKLKAKDLLGTLKPTVIDVGR
jgi:Cys-tRNA(Pro)/Cys-tRNA(Cys) deacylase